jgi:hypothetical protein
MKILNYRTVLIAVFMTVLALLSTIWNPPSAEARAECGRINRVVGQSILVNTCGVCRSIQVIKDRTGNALPAMRTFVLNGGEQFPLPFKGTGGTRITIDAPCRENTTLDNINERDVAQALKQCVFPMKTDRGVVLVNGCTKCRAVVVERRYLDGRQVHKSYAMKGKSVLTFADEGAISAKITNDAACRL